MAQSWKGPGTSYKPLAERAHTSCGMSPPLRTWGQRARGMGPVPRWEVQGPRVHTPHRTGIRVRLEPQFRPGPCLSHLQSSPGSQARLRPRRQGSLPVDSGRLGAWPQGWRRPKGSVLGSSSPGWGGTWWVGAERRIPAVVGAKTQQEGRARGWSRWPRQWRGSCRRLPGRPGQGPHLQAARGSRSSLTAGTRFTDSAGTGTSRLWAVTWLQCESSTEGTRVPNS